MATVNAVTTQPQRGTLQVSWEGLANGDNGNAQQIGQFGDKSVHVKGTFGTGGTCVIQGSNDGATWKTLTDPQGNALSFTAEAIEQILENVRYYRPNVTAGDGSTSLNVYIYGRRSK